MNSSGNALMMRTLNTTLVRTTLKAKKLATKHQIAEATGMSTVTVGTILQKLLAENVVFEVGLVASGGGRPAQQFRFNENHAHVLVLFTHEQDGLDMLHVRVANLFGESVYDLDAALPDINLHTFEPFIDQALEAYATIKAIGFGLPGVELDGKIVLSDYPSLAGTAFLEHYQQRYELPVLFENDVNAASVGYCKRKQIAADATLIYVYFPKKYPPGAGIFTNGKLYKGSTHYAGEVASLPLDVDWHDPELYNDPERLYEAIARMIVAISSLLNPHAVVLHGSFFDADSIAILQQKCASRLPQLSIPSMRLSNSFTLDYQNGVIEETLALLEPQLSIFL